MNTDGDWYFLNGGDTFHIHEQPKGDDVWTRTVKVTFRKDLENIGKPIKFPPARLHNERCDEVVIEISETVNFKARNRNKQLKIEV